MSALPLAVLGFWITSEVILLLLHDVSEKRMNPQQKIIITAKLLFIE